LDTRSVPDGNHSVQVAAVDAAGNETRSPAQTVVVDNTAPSAPSSLSVVGGSAFRSDNAFSLTWTSPGGQVAPITAAHYRICAVDGTGCGAERTVAVSDGSRIDGISVPSTGEFDVRLWLEDAAGNTDSTRFAIATLRYGSLPSPTAATDPTPTATSPADDAPPPTTESLPDAVLAAPTEVLTAAPTASRHAARLRIASVRRLKGRLVVRGSLPLSEPRKLSLTIRLRAGRVLRRSLTTRGGRFAVSVGRVRATRLHGSVLARVTGDALFLPGRATLTLRG
jgi:hypothetical protein